MDRKRLIAALAVLAVLILACIFGSRIALDEWKSSRQGQVGQREPLPGLGYCSSSQIRPCILSINLDPGGGMLINVLVHGSTPDFHLKIRSEAGEYNYECKKNAEYAINALCAGKTMPVGKTLSFLLISSESGLTLAEGNFSIIGLALATPDIAMTPTPITIQRLPR